MTKKLDMAKECPSCEKTYKKIGHHWHHNPKHRPAIIEEKQEIVRGLIMGDGYISDNGKNKRLEVNMVNKKYLKHLDNVFGVLGSGVELKRTAQESVQEHKERNFAKNSKVENYQDLYHWRTSAHPKFTKFRENFYPNGKKTWPKDLKMTPTALKHWYVGDGHYDTAQSHRRIKIAMANEVDNLNKVDRYFSKMDLPQPSNYNISNRKEGGRSCVAVFIREDTEKLFDYMGEPVPGFEYKWP